MMVTLWYFGVNVHMLDLAVKLPCSHALTQYVQHFNKLYSSCLQCYKHLLTKSALLHIKIFLRLTFL